MTKPFDMDEYVRERNAAASAKIFAGMTRRARGPTIEGTGHPHDNRTQGFHPHDWVRRPKRDIGERG